VTEDAREKGQAPVDRPFAERRAAIGPFNLRRLLACVAFVCGVLATAVILTPVLHAVLPFPFERIFSRVRMVAAILGVVVLGGLRRETLARFGMLWNSQSRRFLCQGIVTALPLLVFCTVVEILAGHADLQVRRLDVLGWTEKVVGALATAVAVGFAEEYLFRGFVFTSLRDGVFGGRAWPGMIVTSAGYALVHHLRVQNPSIAADPGLADSLLLALTLPRFVWGWHTAWPSVVGLFLFGMVLNGCVVRARSLYPSIGLHIGAVAFLRMVRLFARFPAPASLFWGSYLVYDGIVGWAGLGVMAFVARRVFPAAGQPSSAGDPVD
jgi:membrane protease YdiL (CAAX protease family)